ANARRAERRLERGIALLVDDAETDALVRALRRGVADDHADLKLRVTALASGIEDRVQQTLRVALAAVVRLRRDPLDDPRVGRLLERAGEKRSEPLEQGTH